MTTVFFSTVNLFAAEKIMNEEKKKATSNEQLKNAIRKLERITERAEMSEGETQRVMASLMNLENKGVSVNHALKLMKVAIKGAHYSGQEVEEITGIVIDSIGINNKADDCAKTCEVCVKNRMQVRDMARVMSAVKDTVGKNVTPGQMQVMLNDLLDKGVGTEGLTMAIEQVRKSVENSFSFRESRRDVTLVVLNSLKEGLQGEELAERIREKTQKKLTERVSERKRISKEEHKKNVSTDTKDQIRIRERIRTEERLRERKEQEIKEEAKREEARKEEQERKNR